MSQIKKIRKHLEDGNSITALKALNMFGCFRLAARIADLKNEGLSIVSEKVKENGKEFSLYSLECAQ